MLTLFMHNIICTWYYGAIIIIIKAISKDATVTKMSTKSDYLVCSSYFIALDMTFTHHLCSQTFYICVFVI